MPPNRPPAAGDATNGLPRLERIKPYKARAPEETIFEIQSRLRSLGLPFVEEPVCNGEQGAHSCSLRLVDDVRGDLVFQSMGKGRTDSFARASAYGEMIERLQNLAVYMTLVYFSEPEKGGGVGNRPFKYYPDEKDLLGEELQRGIGLLFHNSPNLDSLLPGEAAVGVPYWSVFGSCTVYLPFRALQAVVGSNGMCSGNTPAEALIHGICEIFERHVLKQLLLAPRCLPDIPLGFFAGHRIHDDLERLSTNEGLDARVKDCSMGLRLPVVGLLIVDRAGRYAFHLGADPSPITALERCLTEMCQGGPIRLLDGSGLDLEFCDPRVSAFWRTQLHLNIRCYGGHWPSSILREHTGHAFRQFDHPVSVSDENDLEYVLNVVRDAGWELLIRDNTFLGFPAYHVYIPGIGEMANVLNDDFTRHYLAFDSQVHVIASPARATLAQRVEAVRAMTKYASVAPTGQFRAADYLMHHPRHPLARMSDTALGAFLLQPFLDPRTMPGVPACFECPSCRSAHRCNFPFISAAWRRMKQAMRAALWSQEDIGRIVEKVRFPIGPAGEHGPLRSRSS